MQLRINLEEDKELRTSVLQLIKGQTKSVAREYLMEAIEEVGDSSVAKRLDAEVRLAVDRALKRINIERVIRDTTREVVQEEVRGKIVLPDAITIKVTPVVEVT